MVSDRPIHLDLNMPGATSSGQQQAGLGQSPAGGQASREGLDQEARQLRELLDAGRQAPPPPPTQAPGHGAGGVFALFGSQAAAGLPGATPPPEPGPLARELNQQLAHMARRLLVDDGSGGRRAVQMHLDGEQFAGVVLDVCHAQGGVQATFTCSHEEPRERLARHAQWLADGLCAQLGQPVTVSVQTDDLEDPCLVQASASP